MFQSFERVHIFEHLHFPFLMGAASGNGRGMDGELWGGLQLPRMDFLFFADH